jgi:Fic family protein
MTPQNRSEQEIAGYRDVLQTIHSSHEHMPFTPGIVMQLHGDLYKYTSTVGGQWKNTDNEIVEQRPDGSRVVRFRPVPPWATPPAMEELHRSFDDTWKADQDEPLLLIAAYVLDFLCIHSFLDGNARLARLLTLLLLYKAGYDVGRYIGLEKIVEASKESYFRHWGNLRRAGIKGSTIWLPGRSISWARYWRLTGSLRLVWARYHRREEPKQRWSWKPLNGYRHRFDWLI